MSNRVPTKQEIQLENARAWQRFFRDIAILLLGCFMLAYETVFAPNPNPYIIGAGLAALGLPPTLRLNEKTKKDGE